MEDGWWQWVAVAEVLAQAGPGMTLLYTIPYAVR